MILYKKWLKEFKIGSFWAILLKLPELWGPKNTGWQFFHEMNPLSIWILYRKFLKNFEIGPNWADWQTPPIVQNGQNCGALNIGVYIFWHKIDPPLNLQFAKENC